MLSRVTVREGRKKNRRAWGRGWGADEEGGPRARKRLDKKTGLSWVRLDRDTACQSEERSTAREGRTAGKRGEGGVNRAEQGVRVPPWGFDFTPAVLFAAFFEALCLETYFISFMTSSPGVVHASVPCPPSTVCFFLCLCRVVVGILGVGVCVCEVCLCYI